MLSLLLFAAPLVAASPAAPEWHYPRQVANSSVTLASGSAAVTGTAGHNCSWTWDRFLSSSVDLVDQNITSTYTYYNMTASLTTECDNKTRIVGDLTTIATGTNVTTISTTRNFTGTPPTCTPAAADCSDINAGFGTYPCPRPTTNVAKMCGQCSIWGGTVDLIYFPITATTSHTLCPNYTMSPGSATTCPLGPTTASRNATNPYDYQPCYYATDNQTSTTNSGPYVVSGGHTFYQNRAYISLQTAYASDECGFIGQQHEGTIMEVKSEDVYSVGGYHHEFQDAGYQFNFQDLQAVPSYAYYMDCGAGGPASCPYMGSRYRYGTDFLNGYTDVDLGAAGRAGTDKMWIWQEAYTPMLLLPTQIRDLDPAWATCSLNLGGLYDPPKALTQAPSAPEPTQPTDPGDGGTTTAQPGDGPTTPGPTPTALPGEDPSITSDDPEPQPTEDPQPTDGGDDDDDTPAPTTPSAPDDPEETGGDGGDAPAPTDGGDGVDDGTPTTASNPAPTDGGDTGSDNGSDDGDDGGDQGGDDNQAGGDNGGDDGSDDSSSPTPTQNVGGIIASIIGEGASADDPAPTAGGSGSGSESDSGSDSGSDSESNNDDAAAQPAAAPVTFTADDGSTQTISAVEGSSDVFVVGTQTLTAGGSAIDVNGVTVSAGPSGQIVAGTQTLDATAAAAALPTGTDGSTLAVSTVAGSSGVFVVDGSTLSVGGSAATVNGAEITAGPSGVVNVDAAPTGSDGEEISISTITGGSSGVYVADGTTLSVGGEEQVVDGVTLTAAPTGVVEVGGGEGSGTGSASVPQQTGNLAASGFGKPSWLVSAAGGAFAVVLALR